MAVTRTGDVVTVKTAMGLTVSCNFRTDFCSLDLSAFYFGVTGGLLGTFNNELSDELNSRRSVPAPDTDEFVHSWMVCLFWINISNIDLSIVLISIIFQVGRKCDTSNTVTECRQKLSPLCVSLFEDSQSVFRSCFPVVDPQPFLDMCLQDTCLEENKVRLVITSLVYHIFIL